MITPGSGRPSGVPWMTTWLQIATVPKLATATPIDLEDDRASGSWIGDARAPLADDAAERR